MRRLLIGVAVIATLVMGIVWVTRVGKTSASAVTPPVNWDVRGTYTIAFTCTSGCGGTFNHQMQITIEDMGTGTFSGIGHYITDPSYTWNVTGTITNNTIDFDIDYTGQNPSYYVEALGTIASNGSMSGTAAGPGQTFNWSTTTGYAKFNRRAEIISPAADSIVTTTLNLGAYLMDNDYDPVSWAVRKGTCAAATNTVLGNVDAHNDPYTWAVDAVDSFKYNFFATANVEAWPEGEYCFIFNPSEDGGESDIRMTEFFKVNWDADDDGIFDDVDVCPNTGPDATLETLGVNRNIWYGGTWRTLFPGKTKLEGPSSFTMDDTYGCSCNQILDMLNEAGLGEFGGHYKFGCSKSVLEDFSTDMNDGLLDGRYFIETVTIPATRTTATYSINPLIDDTNYYFHSSGTARACWQSGCHITFDAEYSSSDYPAFLTWVDGVAAPYTSYGPDLLDLKVNGNYVDWGTYNPSNTYDLPFVGNGSLVSFSIYDITGSYSNNSGNLYVDIYGEL